MIIRIHISTIHKIQTTSMKRSMRNKRHTFDSSFRSKQHRVAPILDALISLNPGRTSNSIESLEWSVSIDRSLSDQVSNKRQSFVTKKGKRKNIEWYSTRFYSGRSFPLYAPATHTERIQMKFAFQMDSPSHALTRIKYISHECTLQDYHSNYEMEFQVYIYIYTYTRNKSLAPFMTFLHRSIDRLYRAPIYRVDVQNETSYTVVWWMILRGWKWKHSLWRRELVIQPFLREIKVTRQIFLPVTGWK